jgi:hypothetical protein
MRYFYNITLIYFCFGAFSFCFAGRHIDETNLWKHVVTIDRLAWQERQGVKKINKPVSDQEFIRRVYLDITGKIPTYEQTVSFLKAKHINKRGILIDELLDSPGYVANYSNFWLDLLRNPYGGAEDHSHKEFIRFIERVLSENWSYDKIVKHLMTAEGSVQENQAIGFYMRDKETGTMDTLNSTVRAFLGTRLGCAQCHNHRFDKWTQKEFYESAAFFWGVDYKRTYGNGERQIMGTHQKALMKDKRFEGNLSPYANMVLRPSRAMVTYNSNDKLKYPEIYNYENAKPNEIVKARIVFDYGDLEVSGKDRREIFANWMASKKNPMFARIMANRLWKRIMGVSLLDPVDDWKDNIEVKNPHLFTALGDVFANLDYDFKAFLSVMFNSEAYQMSIDLKNEFDDEDYKVQGALFKRMSAAQLQDSLLTLRYGNLDRFAKLNPQYFELEDKLNALSLEYKNKVVPLAKAHNRKYDRDTEEIDPAIIDLMLEYSEKVKELEGYYQVDKNGYINPNGKNTLVQNKAKKEAPTMTMMGEPITMNAGYSGKAIRRAHYNGSDFMAVFGSTDRSAPETNVETKATMKQILKLINSPETQGIVRKDSQLMKELWKKDKMSEKVQYLYYSIYGRAPSKKDLNVATQFFKVSDKTEDWCQYVLALINSPEFYFIK